jgi:hypothetical protein
MLTIERFEKLKGRTFVFPNVCGWTITEAGEYISPVRHDCLYLIKKRLGFQYTEVSI